MSRLLITSMMLFAFGNAGCGRSNTDVSGYSTVRTSSQIDFSNISESENDHRLTITDILLQEASLRETALAYAEQHYGQRLGRGQCWDLVNQALLYAGARPPWGAESYVFGTVSPNYLPGRIMAFKDVVINGWKFSHHVAMVKTVKGSAITILHQNIKGGPVQEDTFDLKMKTAGKITLYQPLLP